MSVSELRLALPRTKPGLNAGITTKGFLSYLELKPKRLPLWHRGSSYPIRNYPVTPTTTVIAE